MMQLANDTPVEVAEAHMTEAFGECIGITGSWGPPDRSWYYTSEHGAVFIYRDQHDAQLSWIVAGLMPPGQGDGGAQFIRDCITATFGQDITEIRAYIEKSNSLSLNYCKKRLPGGAVLDETEEAWVYSWEAGEWPSR